MIRTAAVLGGGAVARALLDALPAAGIRVLASWRRRSGLEPPPVRDVDLVLIAVSDPAIAQVCRRLDVGPGQLVAHLAGSHGLAPLRSARLKGARTGSLHPLRAFAAGEPHDFRGAAAGVAGSDPSAVADLSELASRLGMAPIPTSDRSRALYHAAAVLAAGAQVALFSEAVRAFQKATGVSEATARLHVAVVKRSLLPLSRCKCLPVSLRKVPGPSNCGVQQIARPNVPRSNSPHPTNVYPELVQVEVVNV